MNEEQKNVVAGSSICSLMAGFFLGVLATGGQTFAVVPMLVTMAVLNIWWSVGYYLHISKGQPDKDLASNSWLWPHTLLTKKAELKLKENQKKQEEQREIAEILFPQRLPGLDDQERKLETG